MKPNQLIILAIILGVLVGGVAYLKIAQQPPIEEFVYEPLSVSIQPALVSGILIEKGEADPVTLTRSEGGWTLPGLDGAPAKTWKVDNLFDSFSGVDGELRGSSSDIFEDFGVDEEHAFHVTFLDAQGRTIESFYIGSKTTDSASCFLRNAGSADVYWVNRDLLSFLGIISDPAETDPKDAYWLDLALLSANSDDITSFRITKQVEGVPITYVDLKKEYDAEAGLNKWTDYSGYAIFDLSAEKIRGFLDQLGEINATKLSEAAPETVSFEEAMLEVVVGTDSGESTVQVGQALDDEEASFYVQASGRIYEVAKYNVNRLDKRVSDFFIKNPLRLEIEEIESILIQAPQETVEISEAQTDTEKYSNYVEELRKFAVKTIPASSTPVSFDYMLEIDFFEDVSKKFEAVKNDEGEVLARLDGTETVFEIRESLFKKLFEELEELKPEEEETAPES